jgi:hypothetical protein
MPALPRLVRRFAAVCSTALVGCLLALALTLAACSDDPILGPKDDDDPGGGGSYGNLNRLSPNDTSAADTARSIRPNPRRF